MRRVAPHDALRRCFDSITSSDCVICPLSSRSRVLVRFSPLRLHPDVGARLDRDVCLASMLKTGSLMRRNVVAFSRRPRPPKAAVVAASLTLLVLVAIVWAIAAPAAARTACSTLDTNSSPGYHQIAPAPQHNHTTLNDIGPSALGDRQHTSALSPKLQPNVLSTFITLPLPATQANSPEQSAFVQGYEQLTPLLSATSYIPLSHTATRGIILPAGRALQLGSAYVTLQLLRERLKCNLPVEIWYVAGEIDEHTKAVFEVSIGVFDQCMLAWLVCSRTARQRSHAVRVLKM